MFENIRKWVVDTNSDIAKYDQICLQYNVHKPCPPNLVVCRPYSKLKQCAWKEMNNKVKIRRKRRLKEEKRLEENLSEKFPNSDL